MHGFGALRVWLHTVYVRAFGQFVQLVTLLLLFPGFEFFQLFLKFTYPSLLFIPFSTCFKEFVLDPKNDAIQL